MKRKSIDFGDVIRSAQQPDHDQVVLDNNDFGLSAFSIIDEERNRFGFPGTIPHGVKVEVVGRRDYEEVVQMIGHTLSTHVELDQVREMVARLYPDAQSLD